MGFESAALYNGSEAMVSLMNSGEYATPHWLRRLAGLILLDPKLPDALREQGLISSEESIRLEEKLGGPESEAERVREFIRWRWPYGVIVGYNTHEERYFVQEVVFGHELRGGERTWRIQLSERRMCK